jgi:S-adenosylmethionine-diacylglycerol 3-amino-3-carboxypropyl transferase
MHVADRAFQQLFRHLFVYNMLFEDTEVDERFLDVGPSSRVLGISGAGCGIASHLSRRPRSIDAIDINANHLAITALKAVSARDLDSYEEFYTLWGHGTHAEPRRVLAHLTKSLPRWIQRHWRGHDRVFRRAFHQHGLTARLLATMRKLARVDAAWLHDLVDKPVVERRRRVVDRFGPILRTPWIAALLRSRLNLLALGVNHAQCERMLRAEGLNDIVDFLLMHIGRVAETDLERNWFVWVAVAGGYNHARPDAVPPFMRKDHHETARGAPTELRFHHKNIFDVLAAAGPKTWTHYTLLDAPDWMPHAMQRRLLDEIHRTSVDGAIVLHRSVETDSLTERHDLEKRFVPMVEASAIATQLDRTRQYRHVSFHRVVH